MHVLTNIKHIVFYEPKYSRWVLISKGQRTFVLVKLYIVQNLFE